MTWELYSGHHPSMVTSEWLWWICDAVLAWSVPVGFRADYIWKCGKYMYNGLGTIMSHPFSNRNLYGYPWASDCTEGTYKLYLNTVVHKNPWNKSLVDFSLIVTVQVKHSIKIVRPPFNCKREKAWQLRESTDPTGSTFKLHPWSW